MNQKKITWDDLKKIIVASVTNGLSDGEDERAAIEALENLRKLGFIDESKISQD